MLGFSPYLKFWNHHPALFFGISFLLGLYFGFHASLLIAIPCLSLWFPLIFHSLKGDRRPLKLLALSLLIGMTAWIYVAALYTFPSLPYEGMKGHGLVKIKSLSHQRGIFGGQWLYRTELAEFFPFNETASIARSLPCLIILTEAQVNKHPRPLANQDYWIEGRLMQTGNHSYVLKVSAKTVWIPVQGTWSAAESRYAMKRGVTQWIQQAMQNPRSGSFIAGLATGEFDDHWMREQFARFGLQHLLAISGFHFAITAGFLSFLLALLLKPRMKIVVLLICLGAFCLFVGPQASVLRAWLMCSLAFSGLLLEKEATALNSLGIALLVILGYDPLLCLSLGFQLSFAITGAILLFFQPTQAWMSELLPKRRLTEVIVMNAANQHGYCLLACLRGALALTVAVNLFALPLTLFYFNQFPWMSLLYNLFFPLMASASMCLLLLGALLSFVPWLGNGIHTLNSVYTDFLLRLTYQVPGEVDGYLQVEGLDALWLVIYMTVASLAGIWWKETTEEGEEGFVFL